MSSSASKRAAIECVEDVEVGDVNSVFSTPVALSYDHILEQIFDSLGRTDLLNCRLVSHRWLLFSQKPLQKQIRLYFHDIEDGTYRNPINIDEPPSKHLTKLTALLKKGQSLPDCEFGGHVPIIFPCSRFSMDRNCLSDDDLQNFLNTNGKNIRDLRLESFCGKKPTENILMHRLANPLLHQASNIQNLSLSHNVAVNWQTGNPDRSEKSQLQQTDPEYKEICQKASDLLQSVNGSSLKVLDISLNGLPKVLEFVIRISPKLEEIILWSDNYKYLIVPENRLWLLKSLRFDLDPKNSSTVEEMDAISREVFKLRKIQIYFYHVTHWVKKHPEIEPKIAQTLNRIFQGSWDKLEEIVLDGFRFLRGMAMPDVMPNVKKIEIWDSGNPETDKNSNVPVFPFGFDFQKTFPKLPFVVLANYMTSDDVAIFLCFLNCIFGADPCEPLSTSVKRMHLLSQCYENQRKPLDLLIS